MVNNYNKKRNIKKKSDHMLKVKPSYMCVKCHNVIIDEKAKYSDNATAMIKCFCPFCKKITKFVK